MLSISSTSVDIWWRWKLETNRNVHFLIEKLHYITGLTLLNIFYQYLNNVRRNVHRAAAWQKLCIMPQLVSNYVDISPWTLEKFKLFFGFADDVRSKIAPCVSHVWRRRGWGVLLGVPIPPRHPLIALLVDCDCYWWKYCYSCRAKNPGGVCSSKAQNLKNSNFKIVVLFVLICIEHNFERNEICPTIFLKWTDFRSYTYYRPKLTCVIFKWIITTIHNYL